MFGLGWTDLDGVDLTESGGDTFFFTTGYNSGLGARRKLQPTMPIHIEIRRINLSLLIVYYFFLEEYSG